MAANRANWDSRVPVHLGPNGYELESLISGKRFSSPNVMLDMEYLGDITGLQVVHLQCHIGTDTMSLARHGAHVTGLDFSLDSVVAARSLATRMGIDARFVHANVYDAAGALGETYDLVYTGIGAINWLPDISAWARVVAACLRAGGRLHITEGHPMLYTFTEESTPDHLEVGLPYFETAEPTRWEHSTSYSGDGTPIASPVCYEWNHGLGEIVQAVIDAGMRITLLKEHRTLPWEFWPWMVPAEGMIDQFRLPDRRDLVPLSFTLQAAKER
jgi:SAM-dependent methyltransferase